MTSSLPRSVFVRALTAWYQRTRHPRVLRFGHRVNADILRALGARIGRNTVVQPPLVLHEAAHRYSNLTVGDNCYLNGNNFFDLTARITVEDDVSIGPGVTIMTHNSYHTNEFLIDRLPHTCGSEDVVIKRGANVKAHTLITMGTTIHEDAVVAGGSVVNQDVPARHLVAGNPATIVTEIL